MNKIIDSVSKHFSLHRLAEGIFSAIAVNGGSAICNVGLIDLDGQILLYDTFLTPQAALDLQHYAVDQFGRSPALVIDSHYHNDHIWGSQVFADQAQIISSPRTRELIATSGMEEFEWYSANSAQRLEALRIELENTTEQKKKAELLLWIGEYGGIVQALPQLKVCLPNITFDHNLMIYGTKHTCQLITYKNGHTASDTILYLPQDGIVLMGDLLFVNCHPYLGDGDPQQLLQSLKEISRLEANCFVPGHGPVGTRDDLQMMIDYIEGCYETARALVEKGNNREEIINELEIPETFGHWQVTQFYRTNIKFICEKLIQAQTKTR